MQNKDDEASEVATDDPEAAAAAHWEATKPTQPIYPNKRGRPSKVAVRGVRRLGDEVRQYAQGYTRMAYEALAQVCKGGPGINGAARVAAAKELLDRGWGRTAVLGDADKAPITTVQVVFADGQMEARVMPAPRLDPPPPTSPPLLDDNDVEPAESEPESEPDQEDQTDFDHDDC